MVDTIETYDEPEDVTMKERLNLVRSGTLHMNDWRLIVSALQNLVICCEESKAVIYGDIRQRSHLLQQDIRKFILENDGSTDL